MVQANADQMQDDAQAARRTRGRFQPGQSGNPSGCTKGKRYLELHAQIIGDLGGEANLSGIERVIVGQAVSLLLRSEKSKDDTNAVRLSNAASRLLSRLKNVKRPTSGPTLGDILRGAHG